MLNRSLLLNADGEKDVNLIKKAATSVRVAGIINNAKITIKTASERMLYHFFVEK